MMVLRFVADTAEAVARAVRQTLLWSEQLVPWPLSLGPRLLRVPLDLVVPPRPRPRAVPREPAAARRPAGTEERPARPAERERAATRQPPPRQAPAQQPQARPEPVRRPVEEPRARRGRVEVAPQPAAEPRTATIAGTRSDGPDDAPRYDRRVRARLAPLYTRDVGQGPAIVLLHAFPLNSRMWEPQLEALASRFRVVAPDLAGFGLSWTPDASFSLADQAHAVEVTLDDLQVGEMVLVGLSMGGYVAFPLLRRLGDRVRALVLADTRATADSDRAATDRQLLAAQVEREGIDSAVSELLPRLLAPTTLQDDPELVERVRAIALENKVQGVVGALRAMAARPDSTPQLPRIRCPVLVLVGEHDAVTPPDEAREMARRIPNARVEVLPRAGHLSNLEAPEAFSAALAEFANTAGRNARATTARARSKGAGR